MIDGGRSIIDRRCLLCREYRDVLGNCPGADTPGGQFAVLKGKLACWTPIPAGRPEIDPLSGELIEIEHGDQNEILGPEFPDGLVDHLLSSGPVSDAGDGRLPGMPGDIPPAAIAQAEPRRGATRTPRRPAGPITDVGSAKGSGEPRSAARAVACTNRPAPTGCCIDNYQASTADLRRCCAEPSPVGVKPATSRVADSQGGRMALFGICGRLLIGLAIIGSATPAAAASIISGQATDGAESNQPAASHGTRSGRLGVTEDIRLQASGFRLQGQQGQRLEPRSLGLKPEACSLNPLLDAMRQVESGGDDNAVGDGGKSIGPYQIQLPYWTDGGGDAGRYRLDAWHADRCIPIILGYWRRYCPSALAAGDMQTLARTHNGGPKWFATAKRRAATAEYWRKVQAAMEDKQKASDFRLQTSGKAETEKTGAPHGEALAVPEACSLKPEAFCSQEPTR